MCKPIPDFFGNKRNTGTHVNVCAGAGCWLAGATHNPALNSPDFPLLLVTHATPSKALQLKRTCQRNSRQKSWDVGSLSSWCPK